MRRSPHEEGLPYEENGFERHRMNESEKEMDEYADEMDEYGEH